MKLPDFLIIGAQKCGTTSLVNNLNKHPEIRMCEFSQGSGSEVHFFDRDIMYQRGLDWYGSLFKPGFICGEKTPEYMYDDKAIFRIRQDLPGVKLIVCLRDPVKRFISQLNMRNKANKISFEEAIKNPEYVGRGMYYNQLKKVLDHFPEEQVHITVMDEVLKDEKSLLERDGVSSTGFKSEDNSNTAIKRMSEIFRFIGVDIKDLNLQYEMMFVNKYDITISEDQLRRLRGVYSKENERLFNLLGYRVDSWE
jgi:hypothetical protein